MALSPAFHFPELHPARTAFAACSRWEEVRIVHASPWQTEALSASMLTCLGAMPAICHRGGATEIALEHFRLAGIEPPASLAAYGDEAEAVTLADGLAASGLRLATTLPHAPGIRALGASLVPPELYDHLNDKRNLSALCPDEATPARHIYGLSDLDRIEPALLDYPVYLKGAVEGGSGGGLDVRYCADAEAFEEALRWCRSVPEFKAAIVEAAIPFTASWCLNYAVLDGRIRYLGGAEQLFASRGLQNGSLIDPASPPPQKAVEIGTEICDRARSLGFRGICGLDMCVDGEGRVYFFDLNFRLAGSTCFILMQEGMEDRKSVGIMSAFNIEAPLADLLGRIEGDLRAKIFIPLQLYAGTADKGGPVSRIAGFVRAPSRDEALSLASEFRRRLSA